MINLYPGPSKLNPSIATFLSHLPDVVSMNHRSDLFMELYQSVKDKFFHKFQVPSDYTLAFVSSATECWEILAKTYPTEHFSHISNGAFGNKWHQVNINKGIKTELINFDINSLPEVKTYQKGIVCLTHCETSNGTYLPKETLDNLNKQNPESLLAMDATASLGGIHINFNNIDITFASVQKCLGLPAGLGLLILSPRAIEKAKNLNQNSSYNTINNIVNNANKFQTTHTPNILNIYVLNNLLNVLENTLEAEQNLRQRFSEIQSKYDLKLLAENQEVQSPTVLAIKSDEPNELINTCYQEGIVIGKGYGKWKSNSIRIANFPAHTMDELDMALKIISRY